MQHKSMNKALDHKVEGFHSAFKVFLWKALVHAHFIHSGAGIPMRAKDMNLHFIGVNRIKVKDILSLMIIPHLNGMDGLAVFQQKHIIIPHQTLRDALGLFPPSSV